MRTVWRSVQPMRYSTTIPRVQHVASHGSVECRMGLDARADQYNLSGASCHIDCKFHQFPTYGSPELTPMMTCIQFQFCYRIQCRQNHTTAYLCLIFIILRYFVNICWTEHVLTCQTEHHNKYLLVQSAATKGKRFTLLSFITLFVMRKP